MISLKKLGLIILFSKGLLLSAQVEVFRNNVDTSSYIAPGDTITRSPIFEGGDQDFFRFIETRFNLRTNAQSLEFTGETIKFSFFVNKDGSVSEYTHLSGSNAIVSSEFERIVSSMPKWLPGLLQGKKKKTLMVYNLSIKPVNDFPPVQITMNSNSVEYTDKTKEIKIFIMAGTILVAVTLWIISSMK